jgi:hypothetical protein
MKVFVIAFVALILLVPAALAQTPTIGVYAELSDCQLYDGAGIISSVWVIHDGGPAISAARFRVDLDGWTATFVGAYYPVLYLVEPDPFAGDTFGVLNCDGPPSLLARLDFLSTVQSPECAAELSIVPDPAAASGHIEAFDCDDNLMMGASGGTVVVNPNPDTCPCVMGPIETQSSTWGQIKSLYR